MRIALCFALVGLALASGRHQRPKQAQSYSPSSSPDDDKQIVLTSPSDKGYGSWVAGGVKNLASKTGSYAYKKASDSAKTAWDYHSKKLYDKIEDTKKKNPAFKTAVDVGGRVTSTVTPVVMKTGAFLLPKVKDALTSMGGYVWEANKDGRLLRSAYNTAFEAARMLVKSKDLAYLAIGSNHVLCDVDKITKKIETIDMTRVFSIGKIGEMAAVISVDELKDVKLEMHKVSHNDRGEYVTTKGQKFGVKETIMDKKYNMNVSIHKDLESNEPYLIFKLEGEDEPYNHLAAYSYRAVVKQVGILMQAKPNDDRLVKVISSKLSHIPQFKNKGRGLTDAKRATKEERGADRGKQIDAMVETDRATAKSGQRSESYKKTAWHDRNTNKSIQRKPESSKKVARGDKSTKKSGPSTEISTKTARHDRSTSKASGQRMPENSKKIVRHDRTTRKIQDPKVTKSSRVAKSSQPAANFGSRASKPKKINNRQEKYTGKTESSPGTQRNPERRHR